MENASAGKEGGGDLYFVVQPADSWGFPGGSDGKEFACKVGGPGSIPGWGQIPRRRAWQPAPVFFFFLIHGNKGFFFFTPVFLESWRIPMDRGAWRDRVHGS